MPEDYFSFLICASKDRTSVYVNGLEIGIIENGVFKTTNYNINGTLIPKTFRNLNVPFRTIEEFQYFLHNTVSQIGVKNDVEPEQ